jgi:hypothetical protein
LSWGSNKPQSPEQKLGKLTAQKRKEEVCAGDIATIAEINKFNVLPFTLDLVKQVTISLPVV